MDEQAYQRGMEQAFRDAGLDKQAIAWSDIFHPIASAVPPIQRKELIQDAGPYGPNKEIADRLYLGREAKDELTNRDAGRGPVVEGMGPGSQMYRKMNETANTDPVQFSKQVEALRTEREGPADPTGMHSAKPATSGGAVDVNMHPVSGRLRKYLPGVMNWFQNPENIAKLKEWGIPIGIGAGALGLYGLLKPKSEGQTGIGQMLQKGLLGAGLGALGYGAYKYGPQLYQQGKSLLGMKAGSVMVKWEDLDNPSKGYLTGFVKACRVNEVDPVTLIPEHLVKAAETR